MVFCKKCGKENKGGKFCKLCGEKILTKNSFSKSKSIVIIGVIIFIGILVEIVALNVSIDSNNILGGIKRGNYLLLGKEFCGNHVCIESELYTCKRDCIWCGDGTCQQEEIGVCFDDCEWCGDGYCQKNEGCNSCSKDCGNCKATSYCGDGVCNPHECEIGCSKDCSFSECENGICEPIKGENCVTSPNDCRCKLNEKCNSQKKSCELITCGNGRCEDNLGENAGTCPNDCKEKYATVLLDPTIDLPIIFVHGHDPKEVKGYSPTELEEFQSKLQEEGYEDQGYMLPSDSPPKLTAEIWSGRKVSVIMTYYSSKYDKFGDIVGPDDNQPIRKYAERLRDVIDVVKHNTGKNKVVIIAHSMGGLVSRAYIKYYGGINSVDKLIMIGTPNHGTEGFIIRDLCGVLHPGPECDDMKSGSSFLTNELNAGDETPGNIKYLTIIGRNKKTTNCPDKEYWDNVICASSVSLEGAENYYYDDFSEDYSTIGNSLHTTMVKPSKAPDIYNKVIEFIKN